jgi:hypothetical protein
MTKTMTRFALSRQEYDFLWEHLGLDRRPPILDINSHGHTLDERAELRAEAWASLADKGFGKPGGFHSDLENSLRALARPEWELDARLHLSADGPRTSVLIGRSGSTAAAGMLDTEHLTVWPVSPTGLVRALIGMLPPHPPGTGVSITLPADTLDACAARAGADADAFRRALASEGLASDEARKIADVAGRVIRFGHIGAAHTPRHGKRVRADHVVSFYDDPSNRYLFSRRPTGGRPWVTLAPGTPNAITQQVTELLGTLGGPPHG